MDKGKLEKKLEAKDEKNEKIKLEANAEKNEKLKEFQDMLISTIGSGSDVGTKGIPVHEACKRFRYTFKNEFYEYKNEYKALVLIGQSLLKVGSKNLDLRLFRNFLGSSKQCEFSIIMELNLLQPFQIQPTSTYLTLSTRQSQRSWQDMF